MNKQVIVINGDNFADLESFYSEVDTFFTKDLTWETGHNLDAFDDLLRGGFGIHDYEEPIKVIWTTFAKSRHDLGQELADTLVDIIKHHDHIEFTTWG